MFLVTVTAPRHVATMFASRTRLFDDPPVGLLAAIEWEGDDDTITSLALWETPGARGDFSLERVMTSFQEDELEGAHPERLTPVHVHLRPHGSPSEPRPPRQPRGSNRGSSDGDDSST